ncbi:ATP-grasp domain-containing protein [Streptomyces sp. AJS327]|uniref:ATP-grasp domain-containing protein n=1 Tax=Streptomyces sp. AJS327 TaxID=2545265 RepID=UPI0015DD9FCB|nr:ATP-grasp domain-containing protein [Streptomyces sp. AJS327]MBA0052852.1 ATP-grasp domain-containing protein [Streptomyces sp. AJS327]
MPQPPLHVLLVCSRPRRPSPALLQHPAIGELSVVTEYGHVHDYGPDTAVATVRDVNDPEAVRRAAARLFARRPADAVLAPYETGLPAAGYVRSYYGLPGPGTETVGRFTNKLAMKRRLATAGLSLAPYVAAHSPRQARAAAAELGWPCVVKPAFGGGSKGVAVVEGPEALERYLAADRALPAGTPLLVEEFVPMAAEYHCDAVVERGEPRFACVSRYFGPPLGRPGALTGSRLLPGDHPERAELLELHRRAVTALGLEDGVTHLEVFRTADGGTLLSEIACRPAGGPIPDMIEHRYGVDLWDTHVRFSLSLPSELPVARPESTTHTLNVLLPVRPGVITELTPAAELSALPGVRSVRMLHAVGDLVPEELYSASATGFVHAEVATDAEVDGLLAELAGRFTLRTKPVDGSR